MEEILILIGQLVVELVAGVLGYAPFDRLGSRWKPVSSGFGLLLIGTGLGGLSLLVFPDAVITSSALRIAHLVLAPLGTAFLYRALAGRRAKKSFRVVPREHFWHAFWFTLGWVVVRFAYAQRP